MIGVYDLPQYLHIFTKCSLFFAILFNTFLVYLILTKSPRQLGVYKYLMVFISIFEILYSLLEVTLTPVMNRYFRNLYRTFRFPFAIFRASGQTPLNTIHYSYRSSVVVLITTSDKLFSRDILLTLNSFYWGFFGSSLAIFAIHFVYRYLVISGNALLQTFQSWKLILWLMIPLVIGFIWSLTGIFLCGPTEEFTEFMRNDVWEVFHENIEEFEYLGALMYEKSWATKNMIIYWSPIAGMTIMSLTVLASFLVIVICGYKCYLRIKLLLKNGGTSSARSQVLQTQLFNALAIQTLIPILLLHTPVVLKFSFAIFDAGLGAYCFAMSITIALYPAIDPLPNFFIISPYRKAALGCFKLRKRQIQTVDQNHMRRMPIRIVRTV